MVAPGGTIPIGHNGCREKFHEKHGIYLFIPHTPSNEYYMLGSLQHAIKVKDKNKADRKKGIKVHGVSVLYSRKESEDKNSSCQFMDWFDVAHLTYSLLEAIKVCQGGNGGRETIPLNNCQGKK